MRPCLPKYPVQQPGERSFGSSKQTRTRPGALRRHSKMLIRAFIPAFIGPQDFKFQCNNGFYKHHCFFLIRHYKFEYNFSGYVVNVDTDVCQLNFALEMIKRYVRVTLLDPGPLQRGLFFGCVIIGPLPPQPYFFAHKVMLSTWPSSFV